MLHASPLIAFIATSRAAEAAFFYHDILGLRLVEDSPFALVFDANGTMLRIQKMPTHTAAAHTALGWRVKDIAAMVAGLTARGVRFERYEQLPQDAHGIWTTPDGAQVAWFKDPDGNVLSLTQLP